MDINSKEYQEQLQRELEEESRICEALQAKALAKEDKRLKEEQTAQEEKAKRKADTEKQKTELQRRATERARHAEDIGIKLRVLLQMLPPQPTTEDLTKILLLAVKGMGCIANDNLLFETFLKQLDPEGQFANIEAETPMTIKKL